MDEAARRTVEVSTGLPAAIDTPIDAAAANHSGCAIRPPPPVYTAERVAAVILRQLRHPRREVVAGGLLGRAFVLQQKVVPRLTERLLAEDVDRRLGRDRSVPATSGNLYSPATASGRVGGGWDGSRRGTPPPDRRVVVRSRGDRARGPATPLLEPTLDEFDVRVVEAVIERVCGRTRRDARGLTPGADGYPAS